ncbi:hypothetical protein [Alishewanella sp. HL-SH06]|uniref:hypothetical protein n=1 Tax=Alishewanella sp. HL-SH06 TaxID=3461144 RepID=UPI004041DBF9
MLNKNAITSVIISLLLTGCGGGSGNDAPPGNGSGNNNTTLTLQANVIQETQCGTTTSSPNAEILVHDQNWRIVSRHKANSTGQISAAITGANTVNLSVITFSTGAGAEFVVNSYAQHPVVDMGTIVVPGKTQQGCECRNTNVRVNSPNGALSASDVQLTGFSSPELRKSSPAFNEVLFEQVGLCRVANGSWPLLTAFANHGSANAIAGSIRQYNGNSEVSLTLDQNVSTIPVSVNSSSASLLEGHFTETGTVNLRSRMNSNEAYVFNELDGVNYIMVRASDTQFDVTDEGTVLRSASQRINFLPPINDAVVLNIPTSDAMSALENFLVRDLPSDNFNYNLGAIPGFNTFYLYVQTTLTDGTRYFQSFIGPLQGQYPDEVAPADYGIDDKFDENIRATVAVSVIRYDENDSYQQYLLNQIERSKLTAAARATGKWAKYSTVSIQVTAPN